MMKTVLAHMSCSSGNPVSPQSAQLSCQHLKNERRWICGGVAPISDAWMSECHDAKAVAVDMGLASPAAIVLFDELASFAVRAELGSNPPAGRSPEAHDGRYAEHLNDSSVDPPTLIQQCVFLRRKIGLSRRAHE